jgi:hypothetical protein
MTSFTGRFENVFKPSYMRNHKAVTTKNLRCFPVCGEEHRDNGFCGNEVVVTWAAEGPKPPGELETYAEFQEAEEAPRYKIGQLVSDAELNDDGDRNRDDRNKKNLMKGETKEGKDPLNGTLHFARESKGWHYGWMAGRGNGSHALHEMRVYLFERVSMDKSICRLVMNSTPFVVTSRKRLRGKKLARDEADDGEDDDDDDDGTKKRAKRINPIKGASPAKRSVQYMAKSEAPVLPPLPTMSNSNRQHSIPPFSMSIPLSDSMRMDSNNSMGNPNGTSHITFAQPPRRVPGFVHFGNVQHHQQSHGPTPPQYLPTPPSLSTQMSAPPFTTQRLGGAPQWPFAVSSTPPIYQHSTTPPMYTHPSTTPPIYNLPFSTFGADFPSFAPQPQVSDSDVLESLLGPTPPSSFSNLLSLRPQGHQQVFMQQQRASGSE